MAAISLFKHFVANFLNWNTNSSLEMILITLLGNKLDYFNVGIQNDLSDPENTEVAKGSLSTGSQPLGTNI